MILWSTATLQEHQGHPRLRVVDVRWTLGQPGAGRAAYDAGHLPGAIHLDLDTDLADPDGIGAPGRHPLPDPPAFAARLAALGIGTSDTVVAYDDVGGGYAARLWWMLDDLGHRNAHVLDGGIVAWVAAGLPLTTEVPAWPPAELVLAPRWSHVIDRDALAERLDSVVLLDARAPERYRGEIEPIDPIAGHIPTAISAPSTANLGGDGHFLSPDALANRYRSLGVSAPQHAGSEPVGADVVTYCGSGVTACHDALAMRLAGLPDPILYVGSYSDWSRSGLPVVTGAEAGELPGGG